MQKRWLTRLEVDLEIQWLRQWCIFRTTTTRVPRCCRYFIAMDGTHCSAVHQYSFRCYSSSRCRIKISGRPKLARFTKMSLGGLPLVVIYARWICGRRKFLPYLPRPNSPRGFLTNLTVKQIVCIWVRENSMVRCYIFTLIGHSALAFLALVDRLLKSLSNINATDQGSMPVWDLCISKSITVSNII